MNPECKRKLPYHCDFCGFIGYDSTAWGKHLQFSLSCSHFNKEKEVITGLLPDLSLGKMPYNPLLPNQTSYNYKRYSADGKSDNVNLNIQHDIDGVAQTKHVLNQTSVSYLKTARVQTYLGSDSLPFSFHENEDNAKAAVSNSTEECPIVDIDTHGVFTSFEEYVSDVEELSRVLLNEDVIDDLSSNLDNLDIREEQKVLTKRYK